MAAPRQYCYTYPQREFGQRSRSRCPRHLSGWYRRLFWEAGVLGQALYLAADAGSTTGETIVVDGGLTELGTIQLHPAK